MDLASSTVMVPSLPTLSMASAMISPISSSQLADTVATWRDLLLVLDLLGCLVEALPQRPRPPCGCRAGWRSGLAPAVTCLRPSRKMASARTVAVVVPSPAASEVLLATSRTIWAPMFSYGSSSSISLATVTPSLVTVGEPNFLSRTTLRPLGPRVAVTALARVATPLQQGLPRGLVELQLFC